MRISLAVPLAHDLRPTTAAVSPPAHTTTSSAAGPAVAFLLVLIVGLLLAAIVRTLSALTGMLGGLFALLGSLAIGLVIILVLAGTVLANRAGLIQPSPSRTTAPPSMPVSTRLAPGARPQLTLPRTHAPPRSANPGRGVPAGSAPSRLARPTPSPANP